MTKLNNLVSTDWLAKNVDAPNLRILDASWYMPADKRDTFGEFQNKHIPNAQFFDIEKVSDKSSTLPHMAPDTITFTTNVRELGISNDSKVVIYDTAGIFSAPRVWWLFKLFGHENVAVLDGGLPKWEREGREISSQVQTPQIGKMPVERRKNWSKTVTEVSKASGLKTATIIDARAPGRFSGDVPEPREGLRSGHIPNSKNLYFKELLTNKDTFKSVSEMTQIFDEYNIEKDSPIITSCGSGITASIISLALEICGFQNHALYDGSWAEWGANPNLDIKIGDA